MLQRERGGDETVKLVLSREARGYWVTVAKAEEEEEEGLCSLHGHACSGMEKYDAATASARIHFPNCGWHLYAVAAVGESFRQPSTNTSCAFAQGCL